jgi:hypothetical protein
MKVAEQFFDLLLVQRKTVDGNPKPFTVDEALRTIRLEEELLRVETGSLYPARWW